MHHPHLKELGGSILPIEERCQILLLIGRDLIEAHHVLEQRLGPSRTPFAQKLRLGWVIIGNTYIDKQTVPIKVNTKITNVSITESKQRLASRPEIAIIKDNNPIVVQANDQYVHSNAKLAKSYSVQFIECTEPSSKPGKRTNSSKGTALVSLKAKSLTSIEKSINKENFIPKSTGPEVHGEEISSIHKYIPIEGPIANINMPLSKQPLLRGGSRIAKSDLNFSEKEPVVLSGHHQKVTPFLGHYYNTIKHRGPHFIDRTTGSARWNVRTKRLISSDTQRDVTFRQTGIGSSISSRHTHRRTPFNRRRRLTTLEKTVPTISTATMEHFANHSNRIREILLQRTRNCAEPSFPWN
ncbi:uncharacterized protein LOC134686584 [Mytilus trossulus]|uniref:uncharacterized protein LOC134686584 n=1 Tax=Mytilus trossulus TaxID=6551 RepID=UPI00300655C3